MYKNIQNFIRSTEWLIVIIVVMIVAINYLLLVRTRDYSLSVYGDPNAMLWSQTLWIILGFFVMIVLSLIDYHFWRRASVPLAAVSILISIITILTIGSSGNSTFLSSTDLYFNRQNNIPLIFINVRSLAILSTTLYVATWLYAKRKYLYDINYGLIPLGVIIGVAAGLLYVMPDSVGAGLVIITCGFLFFLLGDIKQMLVLVLTAWISGGVMIQFSATGKANIINFLEQSKDPSNSYLQNYFEMINNGGYFGSNTPLSTSAILHLFNFGTISTLINQCGLIVGIVLIILVCLLVYRGVSIMRKSKDMYGQLLSIGITFMIGVRYFLALTVTLGILPWANIDLPIIGMAGSDPIFIFAGLGILMSVSQYSNKNTQDKQSNYVKDNSVNTKASSIDTLRRYLP